MDLSQITPQQRDFIESLTCEIEIEEHECLTWGMLLWTEGNRRPNAAFLDVAGKAVLIPVPQAQIRHIRVLRVLLDGDVLIVFLQDTSSMDEKRGGGYMVISRLVPGGDWHIATMYRQKFLSSYSGKGTNTEADPAPAQKRLEDLYEISKLLVDFKSVERTIPAVLAIVTGALPLRSAILIKEKEGRPRTIVWHAHGVGLDRLRAAKTHARTAYAYLAGAAAAGMVDFEESESHGSLPGGLGLLDEGPEHFITLPLVIGGNPVFGAILVDSPCSRSEAQLAFVNIIANQLAIALDRYGTWQQTLATEADAHRRCAFLAEASRVLGTFMDQPAMLACVAHLAVPQIASLCAIDVVGEETSIVGTAVLASDVSAQGLEVEAALALGRFVPDVLRTGEALIDLELADWRQAGAERGRGAALHSRICLPLRCRGTTIGALTLISVSRPYGPADVAMAQDLARRIAGTLGNAGRYGEALRAIRRREEILGVVSHELKNPLSTIMMSADVFLRQTQPEEGRHFDWKAAEVIKRAAVQMDLIIRDLLDTASIDAQHFLLEREPHAVVPLVEGALDFLRPLAARKSIAVVFEIAPGLCPVLVDRGRFLQILANLFCNAVKFTPGGGTITIGAAPVQGAVQFTVRDTGPGIIQEHLSHVFERFWQAPKTSRLGTGLGLYIVRALVESHGGEVRVDSTLGEGTTFYFTLPLAPVEAPAPENCPD